MKIKNLTGEDVYLLDTFGKQIVKIPFEYTTSKVDNIEIETKGGEGVILEFRMNCSNRFESKVLRIGQFEPLPPPEKDTVFLVSPNTFENTQNNEKESNRKDFCTYSSLTTLESNGKPVCKELIFN